MGSADQRLGTHTPGREAQLGSHIQWRMLGELPETPYLSDWASFLVSKQQESSPSSRKVLEGSPWTLLPPAIPGCYETQMGPRLPLPPGSPFVPNPSTENQQPVGPPVVGLHEALPAASDHIAHDGNERAARGKHHYLPPHWAAMGTLKIAFFFTPRDDSRVALLGPASREAGGGKWGWGKEKEATG